MDKLKKIKSYILDDEYKITILKNRVDIVNYTEIGHFDSNKIIVRNTEGSTIINGNKLVVSKLMNDEILITGDGKNIELR